MDSGLTRRNFFGRAAQGLLAVGAVTYGGCRGNQTATIVKPTDPVAVGSHAAGGETFKPLVEEATGKLLGRHAAQPVMNVSYQAGQLPSPPTPQVRRICFIGVENASNEELGDFKEQIYEMIDSKILAAGIYQSISRRFVQAGLTETRLRPDQLFVPENMRTFMAVMERQGQPFDYALYAKITSGTTTVNKDSSKQYILTLEMVNVRSGAFDKESATLTKDYNSSLTAKVKHWF